MRFAPKTQAEIDTENLWPVGDYDFEVLSAEETTSKAGNDMLKVTIKVFDPDGHSRTITDYLMESIAYKLRHFAEAVGMLHDYDRGELIVGDLPGKVGRCKVNIRKDKNGQYPDQNGIADYLKQNAPTSAGSAPAPRRQPQAQKALAGDIDDEIPF